MRRLAIVIVIAALVASEAHGQDDDRAAELVLAFDREGNGRITLVVAPPRGRRLNVVAVTRGLVNAVPTDWTNIDRRPLGGRFGWQLRKWPPPESPASRRLDLTPLLTALDGEGIESLRLTVAVHRYGHVSRNVPVRPASEWPHVVYRDRLATHQPAAALEIRYGQRPILPSRLITANAGRWSLALAALALVPLPVAAWRLRRRAESAETERLGHALWRLLKHGPILTTFAWYLALGLTGGLALTTGWLDGPRPEAWILRWLVLFALPPAAATLLAARLARPALDRLRADDWDGVETLQAAPWGAVWMLLAFVLTGSAGVLLFDGYVGLAVATLAVAAVAGVVGDRIWDQQHGPFVQTPDVQLAERVRSFAFTFGVKVTSVGAVVNSTRRADVIPTPKLRLTLPLLRDFAAPFVDALIAQRFALLAGRFGPILTSAVAYASSVLAGICWLGVGMYGDRLDGGVIDWVPLTAAVVLGMYALPVRLSVRSKYLRADGLAASLTAPETLVAALAEQDRRRGEPLQRSWLEDALISRPCAARRAAVLGRRYGWSREDIARLLATPVGADPSRYLAPPPIAPKPDGRTPEESHRYTTSSLLTIGLWVGLPLAFAHLAELCSPGVQRAAVLAAGCLGVPLVFCAVMSLFVGRKNAADRRKLHGRLRAEGIDPTELSGVLVSFAPDREAHNYDNTAQWDLGYLVPAGDRLLFIGRRVRFEVPWAGVDISLVRGEGFWRSARIVVTWGGDASAGESSLPASPTFAIRFDSSSPIATQGAGAFSVWPVGRHAPWGFTRATAELRSRLQEWRDGAVKADSLPAALASLPAPPPTPEGAKPVRQSMNARVIGAGIVIVAGLAGMAAWLSGLPLVAEWRGIMYVVSLVVGMLLATTLPPYMLSGRRERPSQTT